MRATDLIKRLEMAGVDLHVSGTKLSAQSSRFVTAGVRVLLFKNRAELIAALTPGGYDAKLRPELEIEEFLAEMSKPCVGALDTDPETGIIRCHVELSDSELRALRWLDDNVPYPE